MQSVHFNCQGWCQESGNTDHAKLMAYVESLPPSSLAYVKQDCMQAVAALPDGRKAGHYVDTIHYINMRNKKMKQKIS